MKSQQSVCYILSDWHKTPFPSLMLQQCFSSYLPIQPDDWADKMSNEGTVCNVGVQNGKPKRIQPCPEAILRTSKAWKQPIIPGT